MKPITIKDIARELGISVSTVSRALQNHPDISERTKQLVRECAQKLNYKPNLMASNLRTCRNTTIGVVIPELNHHFFSSVLDGIEQTANEAGYQILICQTGEDVNKEIQAVHNLSLTTHHSTTYTSSLGACMRYCSRAKRSRLSVLSNVSNTD